MSNETTTLMGSEQRSWSLAELKGILNGISADGVIVLEEARYLEYWLEINQDFIHEYPFTLFHDMITSILEDGVVTSTESDELLAFIRQWQSEAPHVQSIHSRQDAATFLEGIPLNTTLDYSQLASFKQLLHYAETLTPRDAGTILQLLGKTLQNHRLSPEERDTLLTALHTPHNKQTP